MMRIPNILNSTKPVLYETGYEEWPYAYAGSCFPVRWKNNLYIVSASHCFENHKIEPEKTLYPIPTNTELFFGFCCKLRTKAGETYNPKYYDQVLLQVSYEIHSNKQLNSVIAPDLSKSDSVISLSSNEIVDVWLRGFLSENPVHEVDYDKRKIRQQAYITNGYISSRRSQFDYCYLLKTKTPFPESMSPNGMSGSAVYSVDRNSNSRLAGTVIEYNSSTNEFLVIDSNVLRKLLEIENKLPNTIDLSFPGF